MRKFLINVNGNSYEVEVEEVKDGAQATTLAAPAAPKAAAPAPKAAQPAAAPAPKPATPAPAPKAAVPAGAKTVVSPMPGTILTIQVKVGDSVKKGTVLCILEAMKMENEIMAAGDARVASIAVNAGEAVNTGQVLIVLE